MTFRLIDRCRIVFQGDSPDIEDGLIRQNGDRVTINAAEKVLQVLTLSDGSEMEEMVYSGRTVQVDVINQADVKVGAAGRLTITGFSSQLAERQPPLPDEETSITFTVIPDPRCTSCG